MFGFKTYHILGLEIITFLADPLSTFGTYPLVQASGAFHVSSLTPHGIQLAAEHACIFCGYPSAAEGSALSN